MSRNMKYDDLRRNAQNVGRGLQVWMDLAKRATHSEDLIDDQGNGDWSTVADRMQQLATRPAGATVRRDDARTVLIWAVAVAFAIGMLVGLGLLSVIQ